ncbi:MAG: hypothetical protein NZ480_03750, partial [Bdellovibrionaceae bacterium]|nr:hypothetical protein [Pseudobdellovibrionaceae bacterium]MDW8190025.1 hypothetical protein [Pseudobdellovibrionaceae bacterium]
REHMIKLKNKLWEFFQEQFRDDVQNHSHFEYTSPYFLCCSWKKMMLPKIFMTVAVGRGSACSQLKVKVENRALQAMGVDELRIRNSCRISFGWPTTENEIEKVKAFFRDWGGSH